ncbi:MULTISPECIES: cell division protein FtsZ [unclassified Pseudovibrio]|uniref:cell division protein FtsZ n=1 Tax=unclassified Pseudovibrio TaxID=2627060 RepID=UPI0007AE9F20|nr:MULTISPECIES: cell division protein FtsZ [unclassified Pseudovibrio]KZK94752.1 Cell division protein FtsZ [Pseudovibrio sp. W74]KZL04689.1 Cell division protein FtsZ [Pseudovibrio sp. Ad14]
MTINLKMPDIQELKPRITVFGVGGGGGNAVNNMVTSGLQGCDFVVANTDAQALALCQAERVIQMGVAVTEGLGAGSQPEVGAAAAEEVIDEINDHLSGSHMVFITAGMGGGTGTGAAPVVARAAREQGILTVGVVTKPFQFEGSRRMRVAEAGIEELQRNVDTLIVIPNQNLFRIANAQTTFADAFSMADQVLYSGVANVTDLMVKEGLINLDFADVRSIMRGMGKAMMGTGEASGEQRAIQAAEAAIANPLLDETSMKGARGLLISITGGNDLTLFEVDEAATRIREEVDPEANIILGATFDESLDGIIRVSVVATGIDKELREDISPAEVRMAELTERLQSATTPTPSPAVAAPVEVAPAPTPVRAMRAMGSAAAETLMHSEPVAVATDPEVEISPYQSRRYEPVQEYDALEEPTQAFDEPTNIPEPFIPPVAQKVEPQTRMPRVEDFPPIAQREIRARTDAPAAAPAPQPASATPQPAPATMAQQVEEHDEHHMEEERRPMGLLRRLTGGLGRREDEHMEHHEPVQADAFAEAPRQPAAPRPTEPRNHGAAGTLDAGGRPAPARSQMIEDDQLEIPAFLRRQAT